ncbi:MAG: hypothetical protein CM15mP85_13270 [Rhodobacterales bacterium]|nr:MAG: hypothetical protein CM15mP85_13270 [Rhodobacterales bacterium]
MGRKDRVTIWTCLSQRDFQIFLPSRSRGALRVFSNMPVSIESRNLGEPTVLTIDQNLGAHQLKPGKKGAEIWTDHFWEKGPMPPLNRGPWVVSRFQKNSRQTTRIYALCGRFLIFYPGKTAIMFFEKKEKRGNLTQKSSCTSKSLKFLKILKGGWGQCLNFILIIGANPKTLTKAGYRKRENEKNLFWFSNKVVGGGGTLSSPQRHYN